MHKSAVEKLTLINGEVVLLRDCHWVQFVSGRMLTGQVVGGDQKHPSNRGIMASDIASHAAMAIGDDGELVESNDSPLSARRSQWG